MTEKYLNPDLDTEKRLKIIKFNLNEKRELITEYTKQSENNQLSVNDMKKDLKVLTDEGKDIKDNIVAVLSEVYEIEAEIKILENKLCQK